ncbi:MAG: hypothetical protein AAB851_01165, partial [Patescibacteria group bacterium]
IAGKKEINLVSERKKSVRGFFLFISKRSFFTWKPRFQVKKQLELGKKYKFKILGVDAADHKMALSLAK